jgi:SLT domain-containing protein
MQTGGGGGGAEGWRPSVRAAIAQYGPGLGIQNTQAWENALVRQIATESGGNPGADNPTDSNGRGGQQHVSGLLQFLPSTFASHNISGGGYLDPNAQIAAALSYVMNRYGVDSSGAPLQIGRGVGYDTGGYLPPGSTTVNNQTGKPELVLNPDQQKQLAEQGVDPAALLDPNAPGADPNAHGLTDGAAPGPQAAETLSSNRTGGFIPTAASNTGVAGTSALAGYLNLGNEAIGGLIDTGASLAQTGASLALAGTGAGAAGSMAASYGIQMAAQTAKRAVSFGFQAASIGADALIAQLFPFGAPRWIGYDYTNFMPQMGISQAATTTLEKAGNAALQQHFGVDANGNKIGQPGGPVNPSTMAGAQAPIQAPDQVNPGVSAPSMTPSMDSTPGGPNSQAGSMAPDWMQRLGVYDQGGVLDPGQLAVNASRVPEQILTKQQWDSMSKLSVNDRNAPLVKIDAIYGMSPEDVSNQIASKQRLAMMRYAGRP